eukprot:gene2192-1359_t
MKAAGGPLRRRIVSISSSAPSTERETHIHTHHHHVCANPFSVDSGTAFRSQGGELSLPTPLQPI